MAHKKAAASGISQHKNPSGKRLGVKLFDGQKVFPGSIIVRQKGTKIRPGKNVNVGKDFTLYSTSTGTVKFGYSKQRSRQKKVDVI